MSEEKRAKIISMICGTIREMYEATKLIVLAFISTLWSINMNAFEYEGIIYDILSADNKTACVARQVSTDQIKGDVQIPRKVSCQGRQYTVTEIAGWAFSNCDQMTSITIPATIKTIGYSAFYWCDGLKAVYSENLAVWCGISFGGGTECNPLSLAHHLYVNGEEVKDLVIPEGVTSIGGHSFQDATALTSVVIPSSVTKIGDEAFAGCSSITNLSIASGVKVIGFNAFGGCSGLKEVTIPEGTEHLEPGAFYHCGQLASVSLPQSLLSIGNYAFEQCRSLTSIEIPDQVVELGARAFYECDELTSVKLSDNIPEIGDWTFTRCYKLKSINIPKNLKRLGDYSLFWCSSIEELTLPSTLTDISSSALISCKGIRSLIVEDGNPKYLSENSVLFNYDKTTLMFFPAQSDITHYDIPTTVTTILPAAFSGCQLKSITLPTLTEIGDDAFGGMAQLESIALPSSINKICFGAFSGCKSLKEVDIPDNVQSIDRAAFSDCSSLVRVHLPEGLTRIEGFLFDGCTSLSEVNIPDSLSYIGLAAFRSCRSLPDFQIPECITIIDDEAFRGCQTLHILSIPDNVENVGWNAYMGCSGLEKIALGRSVKALEGGTFCGCDNIREIWSYIEEPFNVFDYDPMYQIGRCFPEVVTREAVLYVPQGTKERYLAKQGWRDFANICEIVGQDVKVVSVHDSTIHTPYYNLNGHSMNNKPSHGLYIQNGKKYIGK